MRQFAVDELLRDDTNHLTAGLERGVGQDSHQANVARTVDQANVAAGEENAEVAGRGYVFGARSRLGATKDTDRSQSSVLREGICLTGLVFCVLIGEPSSATSR